MNATVKDILQRRSVRAFTEAAVSREHLELLAQCGAYAPSALNRQSRRFTVVTNADTIARLCRAVGNALGRTSYDMYRPAALIIPSDERENPFYKEDISCALQNIFLAAQSLGIGSVWINQLGACHEEPSVRALLRSLKIPEDHLVLGIAALGYSRPEGIRPPNKTNEICFAD